LALDNSAIEFQNLGISLEPRIYLGMAKKIEEGTSANNLSGNYLGLQLGYTRYYSLVYGLNSYHALANFGIQRRLLRRGYIDLKAGLGSVYSSELEISVIDDQTSLANIESWRPAIQLQASIGIAFGQGRPEDGRICNALLCYEEDQSMLKFDLIRLASGISSQSFRGDFAVAYERKIWQSPFSIQVENAFNYFTFDYIGVNGNELIWEVSLEPRYYYNLKKRMAQGKSVNNLSANFLSLRFAGEKDFYNYTEDGENKVKRSNERISFIPTWGIQRRIFKRGYFAYQLGVGGSYTRRIGSDNSRFESVFFSRFSLGIAI
jgi:hypothetical protein